MGLLSGILGAVAPIAGSFFGPIGSAIGAVASSAISSHDAREAVTEQNAMNVEQSQAQMAFQREQQERAHAFSAAQIAAQRGYETEMSNTSWQRGIADMRAAGLNPMLAYHQGGASTPASPAPQGVTGGPGAKAEMLAPKLAAINTAFAAEKVRAEVQNIDAQTDLVKAQVPKVQQETRTSTSSAAQMDAHTKDILARLDRLLPEQLSHVRAQAGREFSQAQLNWEHVTSAAFERDLIKAREQGEISHSNFLKIQILLDELKVPRALGESRAYSGALGDVAPYLHSVLEGTSSASQFRNMFRGNPWRR